METLVYVQRSIAILLICSLISCEEFVEVEPPNHKMASEVVFSNDQTAISAMTGIYNQLFNASFSGGGPASVTVLAGLSGDNVSTIRETNIPYLQFEQHEVLPDNFRNLNLWSSAYNIIYLTNSLLEGLSNSTEISQELQNRLEGEARFVRAFTYFYLVNLYGEVPLVLSTDYMENSLVMRNGEEEIHLQVQDDLELAIGLLKNNDAQESRTRVHRLTAVALMARVQLYLQNWEQAEMLSSELIEGNSDYELLDDLDQVFLAGSREAIWQLSPISRGSILTNTNEGAEFIVHPFLSFLSHLKLTDSFVNSFTEEDKRQLQWIGYHTGTESYYSHKYKINNSSLEPTEYSMILRLAEQYLIRAEARAMTNNLAGAVNDLDIIRERAGLQSITVVDPSIGKQELLGMIWEEKSKELFAEWGHRWFDLKRTGRADEVLGTMDNFWQSTDVLYPIPEAERMKNINLTQNNGY